MREIGGGGSKGAGALLPELAIRGLAIWAPGYLEVTRLRAGDADPSIRAPAAELLPVRLRRRCSLLTRICADVVARAGAQAGLALGDATIVFASVYGEIQTTGELLAMMVDEPQSPLSPTRFHNSVHNTAIGYLSIATKNHNGSTAISAGPATTAMAMLEAATLIAAGQGPVVVAIAEEPLPEPLASDGGRFEALGVALVVDAARGPGLNVRLVHGPCDAVAPSLPAGLAGNPCASALELALALADPTLRRVRLEPAVIAPGQSGQAAPAAQPSWHLEIAGGGAG